MPDQPRTAFEMRLADAFGRYVADAPTSVDAIAMAAAVVAAPGHGRGRAAIRRGSWISARTLLVAAGVVLAAALLGLGVGGFLTGPTRSDAPTSSAAASLPSTPAATLAAGAPAWESIYLRSDATDSSLIDVVAVRPDGKERLLRQIPTILPNYLSLSVYGAVSENGWLAIGTMYSGQLPVAAYALFDLARPAAEPMVVPYPPVIGGHWSSNGLFALSSAKERTPTGWMSIDVVDPRTRATTELGKIGLFGGEPSIVWARDGSGILDGGRLKPVDGGSDILVDPNLLFTDRRVGMGGRVAIACPTDAPDSCEGVAQGSIGVRDLGQKPISWYSSTDPAVQIIDAEFAFDGRSLLVLLEGVEGARKTVILGRVSTPGAFQQLVTFDLPDGGYGPGFGTVDPADQSLSVWYSTGPLDNPVAAQTPILHLDGTNVIAPVGTFVGFISGPLVESLPGIGAYGPVAR